jgi:MerR family transcriptional regulator, heat shock protein HspR
MEDWRQRLDDEDAPMYPIGVVAELLDVDVQVIRRYDDTGIVRPERSQAGQRRYSRRDIARLAHVLNLADEGVSLPGIKRILDLESEVTALRKEAGSGKSEQG